MWKETELEVPANTKSIIAQGFGGYHAEAVTEDSHNTFEEVPPLGIAGDMAMAAASAAEEANVEFHTAVPAGSRPSNKLCQGVLR